MQMNGTNTRISDRAHSTDLHKSVPWQKCQKIEYLLYELSDIQKGTERIARDSMIVAILSNSDASETFRVKKKKEKNISQMDYILMYQQTIALRIC